LPTTTAHLITHTHWDREWFLTSVYTSRWLPGLIDKVDELVAANPAFQFLFDGQTLVIEDLLALAPGYAGKVQRLISGGHLLIGPYYCQPDWRLTSGELLLRNLQYGLADVARYGGRPGAGWLVDTFGHIRQTPQIHRLYGIESVYVWRGVPVLEPYFMWQAPDGSQVLTLYLVGGYRNLYGVTHAPEVAVSRLRAECQKLQPLYPTPAVPLFDGYDLEDDPEDPVRFYAQAGPLGPEVAVEASTPEKFALAVRDHGLALPVLASELNSGKYGATFPGTLSARTYLKIMAHDCEQLLLRWCEPLAALARLKGRAYLAAQYEAWGRALLQNAVHDALCGVSIDQVHEKMEYSYRQIFEAMRADLDVSLSALLADFASGDYAVSTNPFALDQWQRVGDELVRLQTTGIGVWPVVEREALQTHEQPLEHFDWRNSHYATRVTAEGLVQLGGVTAGEFVVFREKGDTYSDERGERLGGLALVTPVCLVAQSARHSSLAFTGEWQAGADRVTARVLLQFDLSPVVTWTIALDTRGTDLRIELVVDTGLRGERYAGMPFDLVPRPARDDNLLPRQLPENLAQVLLGQRELGSVDTFPFQEMLALAEGDVTAAILARGLHAYAADDQGTVRLVLSRAVEWLTKGNLEQRVGDAGPFLYVPDARGERVVEHVVGLAVGPFAPASLELQALNAAFQNPPMVVRAQGTGTHTTWAVLGEVVPVSSLTVAGERVQARFYNPTAQPLALAQAYLRTDIWGDDRGQVAAVASGEIVTVALPQPLPELRNATVPVECLTPPRWRVGANTGRPDPAVLAQLEASAATLGAQAESIEALLNAAQGTERLRLLHRYYVLKRECVEAEFSLLLNQRKLAEPSPLRPEYLNEPDPDIASLGLALNRLRIKRRIFDYIVQALPVEP
jgi:alpha-mannosidase